MRTQFLLGVGLATAACGADVGGGDVDAFRPSEVRSLTTTEDVYEIESVSVLAAHSVDDALAGTPNGWSRFRGQTFESVTELEASSAAAWSSGYLILGPDGLNQLDSAVTPSALQQHLESEAPGMVAFHDGVTWVGAGPNMFRLDDVSLLSFAVGATAGISALSDTVVARTTDKETTVLRRGVDDWERAELGSSDAAVPFSDGSVAILNTGELERWDDGVRRPIAVSVDGHGVTDAQLIAVDPSLAALWIITPTALYRLNDQIIESAPRPAALEQPLHMAVGSDGTLWVADSSRVIRIQSEREPVTFATDVQPFYDANCSRCHRENGVGHLLVSYESWVEEIDQIIEELETKRMPQDGQRVVAGSTETIRQWRDEGFAR